MSNIIKRKMYLNKSELNQKCFANVFTQNMKALTPGKVWVNSTGEIQFSVGLDQKVTTI